MEAYEAPQGPESQSTDTAARDAAPTRRPRRSLAGVAGRLALTNGVITAMGLITGPLQARALGPAGRGTLAAIAVPLSMTPWIFGLGLTAFATTEAARMRSRGELVGTLSAL